MLLSLLLFAFLCDNGDGGGGVVWFHMVAYFTWYFVFTIAFGCFMFSVTYYFSIDDDDNNSVYDSSISCDVRSSITLFVTLFFV